MSQMRAFANVAIYSSISWLTKKKKTITRSYRYARLSFEKYCSHHQVVISTTCVSLAGLEAG